MSLLSDFLAPIAKEAKVMNDEFQKIKSDFAGAVTSGSQIANDIKQNATKITDSIKSEANETVDSVKKALLSPEE